VAIRSARSPFTVTLAVWRALFLREAVARLARNPMAWFWLIAEPVGHIVLLMWLFLVGFRQRAIAGADTSVFIMIGVLAFFLPRNMMNQGISVVDASEALYTYRQVKPIDTVIARVLLESLLASLVFLVVWAGAAVLGFPVSVADPLGALGAAGALWLAGFGLALSFSVIANFNAQTGHLVRLLMGPLYLFSALMYPTVAIPPSMRDAVLLNPLVHGIESLRLAFMPAYKVPAGIDLGYLYQFGVMLVFAGLALHVRYRGLLTAK
jgi:capsular polysaccharide transport system permease protein